MDLQARKIQFVQEFLRLNSEKVISKFEQILHVEKKKPYSQELTPMALSDFNKLIDSAEEDALSGRVRDISELDKDIDTWG